MRFAHNLRRNTAMPLTGPVRQPAGRRFLAHLVRVLTIHAAPEWLGRTQNTRRICCGYPSMCRAGATMDQQPVIDLGPLGDIDRSGDLLREQIWLDPSRNLIHRTNLGRLCEREVRSADEGPGAGEIWCVFIPLLEGSDAKFRGLHDFCTLLLWGGCQRGQVGRSFSSTLSPS